METSEVDTMTNEQSKRLEILARIDELERLTVLPMETEVIEYLEKRLKELRQKLDTL